MPYGPESLNFSKPSPQTEGVIALRDFDLSGQKITLTEGFMPVGDDLYVEALRPATDTVVALTPAEIHDQTLDSESFFINVEGKEYDLKDVDSAKDYLTEVHDFELPESKGDFDDRTLYHLARAIQKEKRAGIDEETNNETSGEVEYIYQNVAEHSFNVSVACLQIASTERTGLNLTKIGIMAPFHDLVPEAHGKDTPIHSEEAKKTKEFREMASTTIFMHIAGKDSVIAQVMKEYEEGRTPEARFVKGIDKVEAAQHALDTKAILHRVREEKFEDVARGYLTRASIDPTAYDLMQGIVYELGRKWMPDWKCEAFEGDYRDIVSKCIKEIETKSAEVLAFEQAIPDGEPIPEQGTMAEVREFPMQGLVEIIPIEDRRIIDEQRLKDMGLLVLGHRGDSDKPTPTPPTPPMAPALRQAAA